MGRLGLNPIAYSRARPFYTGIAKSQGDPYNLRTMIPRIKLAEAETSDGAIMSLYEHDGEYAIFHAGHELMISRASASERLLGTQGIAKLKKNQPAHVLIGGLGLGFTLRSVLDAVGPDVLVDVAELMPEVVHWNREYMYDLNGACLDDPRVTVLTEDVTYLILDTEPGTYDVILLDIDNGPDGMVAANNTQLYTKAGLHTIRVALKSGGRAVFWSAGTDKKFEARLAKIGFKVTVVPAKIHEGSRQAPYRLYVADYR
jgi:spermidine synthase